MRRTALLILLLLAAPALVRAAEVIPEERVFLEIVAEPDPIYVQQPFRVILRVGIEREFAETNLVSLFNRRMDLQLHVRAPWLIELPDVELLPDLAQEGTRLSLAVNDDVVEAVRAADRTIGGREFTVVEIHRWFRAGGSGEIVLPAPTLRFAWATEFVGDFISGKRPKDRRDLTVSGEALTLPILPFPEKGRPANFTGAVGAFTIHARADVRKAGVDDPVRLTLTIEGEGNLTAFDTPDLGDLKGFHVLGAIDDYAAGSRTIVYDLVVLAGAEDGIPAVTLPFFDPGPPARYLIAMTAPIPLELPAVTGTPPSEPVPATGDDGPTSFQLVALLFSVVVITVAVVATVRRRARRQGEVDPEELRARQALSEFKAAVAAPDANLAVALVQYLSVHLDCAPAGVITPELAARLMANGVPEDPATRAAALVESLVAMNYGSTLSTEDAAASATGLVDELEPHFRG